MTSVLRRDAGMVLSDLFNDKRSLERCWQGLRGQEAEEEGDSTFHHIPTTQMILH